MELPTSGKPVLIRDVLDVSVLVAYLRRESRSRHVAVLTVGPGKVVPFVSADDVARAGGGAVDVVTIPSDDLTHAFTDALSDSRAGVYQGACRLYPPGTEWETSPFAVPLHMARYPNEIADLPRNLLDEVRRAVEESKRPKPAQEPKRPEAGRPPALREASGQVVHGLPPAEIASCGDAEQLASHLRSEARNVPAVVVSRATGTASAYADVTRLRADLKGIADVFEIVNVEASWAFSRCVPDMCQVYGGASRVYPSGTEWERDPYLSPLRFAYGRPDREIVTRQVIADAMGMASTGNLTLRASQALPAHVVGEVDGVVGQRALVQIQGQFPGVLWPELVEPGLPAERLFVRGMRVEGELDPESRRIDVRGQRQAPDLAVANYQPDETILVRLSDVSADSCTVELFPGFTCTIPVDLVVDDATDLRELMTVGEVLPAWFGGKDEVTGEWLLSLQDASDPMEAAPAPSVLVGGPPWLVYAEPEPADRDSVEVDEADEEAIVAEPSAAFIEALQRDKDQLVSMLKQSQAQVHLLQEQLNNARTKLREAIRRKSKGWGPGPDDSRLFESNEEQLDFEIRLAWARMTGPTEKKDLSLKRWTYNPQFIQTMQEVQGVSKAKIVEVIVHVLTGRDSELASRELHLLKTGKGGDDPPVVRDRGEYCWRVSLQTNTASARRLHYWACADGSIELSSIRLHDDFRP